MATTNQRDSNGYPRDDYVHAIMGDITWALRKLRKDDPLIQGRIRVSTYLVLNTCRVLAFVRMGQILSKAVCGAWVLPIFPEKFSPRIGHALRAYRNTAKARAPTSVSALLRRVGEREGAPSALTR
jgi:hypothetical protein